MKSSVLCALATVFTHQTFVEGFAASFLPRHAVSQQHRHGGKAAAVKMFFGGPSGAFPKLYDGWFKKTGQIQKDMVAGAQAALRCVAIAVI